MKTIKSIKGGPVSSVIPPQTLGEEIANSVLHGFGIPLAISGLVLMVLRRRGGLGGSESGALALASCVIFTAMMIIMFLASTLYHAVQRREIKKVFRVLDHSAIYLLIAGTYTPFCLLGLRGVWGWIYFGFEWGLAVAGIVLYVKNCKFIKRAELAIYLLMGWAIALGLFRLYRNIPRISFILLLGGGLAYTLGTLWYRKHNRRGTHAVWHVFVLAGAVCHWWAIWFLS